MVASDQAVDFDTAGGTTVGSTMARMAKVKISISLSDDLYGRVRTAAGDLGVSAWLAEAAAARLRRQALHEVANEIAMATGGPLTDEELEEARVWLHSSSTPAR